MPVLKLNTTYVTFYLPNNKHRSIKLFPRLKNLYVYNVLGKIHDEMYSQAHPGKIWKNTCKDPTRIWAEEQESTKSMKPNSPAEFFSKAKARSQCLKENQVVVWTFYPKAALS